MVVADGGLRSTVERLGAAASESLWLAWEVPSAAPELEVCCWYDGPRDRDGRCCRLDSLASGTNVIQRQGPRPANRLGGDLIILLRLEEGRPATARAFSGSCFFDPGGERLERLDRVDSEESVAFLTDLYAERSGTDAERTLAAVALHASPVARDPVYGRSVRKQAFFWLARSDDPRALELIEEILLARG